MDGDPSSYPPNKTRDAWVMAIRHDWTLDKVQAHEKTKDALENTLETVQDPVSRLLAYSAVWSNCARNLRQVEVETIVWNVRNNCSFVAKTDKNKKPPTLEQAVNETHASTSAVAGALSTASYIRLPIIRSEAGRQVSPGQKHNTGIRKAPHPGTYLRSYHKHEVGCFEGTATLLL